MSTITGQYIADGAWTKVNEATGGAAVRWPATEALRWLNNGQREVVNRSPRSNTKSGKLAITNTDTRQDLIALGVTVGVQVIDILRNVSSSGTPRRALTKRDRVWLDDQLPGWHATAPAADAIHWMYDDRDPLAFFIYPPILNGNKLEIVYAAAPTDLNAAADVISLPDIYANALEFFLLFSFYSKDTTYTKSPQMAQSYWQLFMDSVMARQTVTQQNDQAGNQRSAG